MDFSLDLASALVFCGFHLDFLLHLQFLGFLGHLGFLDHTFGLDVDVDSDYYGPVLLFFHGPSSYSWITSWLRS